MPNVGFLLLHPSTHSLASFTRVRELSLNLAQEGFNVFIFTPYEEHGKLNGKVKVVKTPGFPTPSPLPRGLSGLAYNLTRRIYYSSRLQKPLLYLIIKRYIYGNSTPAPLAKLISEKYKIDILQAEQDNAGLLVLGLRDKFKGPLVLDLHGIWTEELIAAGTITRGSEEYLILQRLMSRLLNSFDAVLVLGDEMKEYVLNKYKVPEEKIEIVPPGGYPRVENIPERRGPPRIVYAGTLTYSKGLELILQTMYKVNARNPKVRFYLTRRGELVREVIQASRSMRINVKLFWFKDPPNFYDFLSKCHVGLQIAKPTLSAKLNIPSKVFDYFSVGLPVVVNDIGGWVNLLRECKAGLAVKGGAEELAEALLWLISDSEVLHEYSVNALNVVREDYNWGNIARRLAKVYDRLLGERG